MKLGHILALILLTGISSLSMGQTEPKLTFSVQNSPIKEVLEKIEEQTSLRFSYSSSVVNVDEKITLQVTSASLKNTLEKLFDNTQITYAIRKNKIILQFIDLRQVVKGRVLDLESKEPIIGANVVLNQYSPPIGGVTDVNGYFYIPAVPLGRKSFAISSIGYEKKVINDILVGSGKQVNLSISLTERVTRMNEIVVSGLPEGITPLNEMALVSARSFGIEDTKRFAVSLGDPGRLVQSYAGVVSADDTGNEIIIRGNSPKGLLWRLEGVEIPSPSHFSAEGGSGGGISMFSTQVMSRSDFITGAFPAQYGNAMSGVFDIRLRHGNQDKHEYTFQAGLLGVDVSSEGPFKKGKKSSFLFNYRYSTLAILERIGIEFDGGNESNVFQDLSFKFNFPHRKFGTVSLFGLGGLSSFKENLTSFDVDEAYNLGIIGVGHTKKVGLRGYIENKLVFSNTRTNDRAIIGRTVDVPNEEMGIQSNFRQRIDIKKRFFNAQTLYGLKLSARTNLETGAILRWINYNYNTEVSETEVINGQVGAVVYDPYVENNGTRNQHFYTSLKHKFSNRLSLVSGIHVLNFKLANQWAYEPRFGLSFFSTYADKFSFSFGLHSRQEPLEFYFATDETDRSRQPNMNLGITRAAHWVLGHEHYFNPTTSLKTEIYYQHLFKVPINRGPNTLPISTLTYGSGIDPDSIVQLYNEGVGRNYGIDMTLEKRLSRNYYITANASLFRSKYTGYDQVERNTIYDGLYAFNVTGGREFALSNSKTIGLNIRWLQNGNKRYTPSVTAPLPNNPVVNYRLVYDESQINIPRFRDYMRLDLQFVYRNNKPRVTEEIRFDIQNVFNRKNVLTRFWNEVTGETGFVNALSRIPVISYRIEF